MYDHVAIPVSDLERSRRFYEQALKSFDPKVAFESEGQVVFQLGSGDFFGLRTGQVAPVHVAFAGDRSEVHAFHEAAVAAGGEDNGTPGIRPELHEHYYAAFVKDPDGHNIEVVCHKPE